MRALTRILFAAYLLILLWLLLFKFSYDPFEILSSFQTRSVNLIPFTRARNNEMIANFVAFIPFGVLFGMNFRQMTVLYGVLATLAFSLSVEIIQYVLAIGVTDITDVITNTVGGGLGLTVYGGLRRYFGEPHLDRFILVVGALSLLAILYLRVFVFIVKY